MTNTKEKNDKVNSRLLGLDILKILSMFFIIVHHLSKHGNFFFNSTGVSKVVLIVANALFLPSVNIFVFVSAYLIVKKGKASFKNYIKLYGQIVFYSVLTYIIACLLDYQSFSIKLFIKNFLPIAYPVFWFSKAYLVMYILSPLLLKIVKHLEKKEYTITTVIIFVILIYGNRFKTYEFLPLAKGFNAIWFAIIFLLAGYQARFGIKLKKKYFLIIYIISLGCSVYSIIQNQMSVDYTDIFVVIQTISLFNLLYDIKTQNQRVLKVFTYISTCTFGIYLLHDGNYLQTNLYSRIFRTYQYFNLPNSLLYFLLFALIIIAAGIIVETIRKLVVKIINICANKIILKYKEKKLKENKSLPEKEE